VDKNYQSLGCCVMQVVPSVYREVLAFGFLPEADLLQLVLFNFSQAISVGKEL